MPQRQVSIGITSQGDGCAGCHGGSDPHERGCSIMQHPRWMDGGRVNGIEFRTDCRPLGSWVSQTASAGLSVIASPIRAPAVAAAGNGRLAPELDAAITPREAPVARAGP